MNKYLGHFRTITKHKITVGILCFRSGFFWRGLNHDNSKYSPIEFFSTAKYFQGNRSPIEAEKAELGYSLAWQHHKGRNPHHWEYWVDDIGTGHAYPIRVKFPYLIEMMSDYIGAGMVYQKKQWTKNSPLIYFEKFRSIRIYHPTTLHYLEMFMHLIADYGLKAYLKYVRKNKKVLQKAYEADRLIMPSDMPYPIGQ